MEKCGLKASFSFNSHPQENDLQIVHVPAAPYFFTIQVYRKFAFQLQYTDKKSVYQTDQK